MWRATGFATGLRIDCLLADDDCGACDRATVSGRKTLPPIVWLRGSPAIGCTIAHSADMSLRHGLHGSTLLSLLLPHKRPCKWVTTVASGKLVLVLAL
jgi:hypothetical protein